MEHSYYIHNRRGEMFSPTPVSEDSIHAFLYASEIEYFKTVHLGKDKKMTHYFKFKEVADAR